MRYAARVAGRIVAWLLASEALASADDDRRAALTCDSESSLARAVVSELEASGWTVGASSEGAALEVCVRDRSIALRAAARGDQASPRGERVEAGDDEADSDAALRAAEIARALLQFSSEERARAVAPATREAAVDARPRAAPAPAKQEGAPRGTSPRMALAVGPHVTTAGGPLVVPSLRLGAAYAPSPRSRIGLAGTIPLASATIARAAGSADVRVASIAATASYDLGPIDAVVAPTAMVAAGLSSIEITGQAAAPHEGHRGSLASFTATAGVGARVTLSPALALRVLGEVGLTPAPSRVVLAGSDPVAWGPLTAGAGVSLEVRLGDR